MLAPSRRPTAMCIVLSSKRSPHAESGNAFNQSPLCGALTACSRALSLLSLRLLVRVSLLLLLLLLSRAALRRRRVINQKH